MLGGINVFIMTGCRVTFPVSLLITTQSSPTGSTMGAELIGVVVGGLMVATCLSMRF